MAADRGVTVHQVDIRQDDVTLDLEDLESKLGPRTRLVAVGYASNAVGTVNPVKAIVERAHEVGALTYVDAVAYAPHGPIDVRALDTDFLVTSVYKWFGPHLGALYGKAEVLDRLPAFKVRPAHDRFETGTQSFESIAGTLAATDYLRDVGRAYGDVTGARRRRRCQRAAARARGRDDRHRRLRARARDPAHRRAARASPASTIHGITDPARFAASASRRSRSPSMASTRTPRPRRSDATGIYVWDGDFYATGLIEALGKAETGGVLRIGLVHYNTAAEVDRALAGARADRGGLTDDAVAAIQARLARGFDPAELRRIKRLWVRHSIAEDRRDIDGLIATLAPRLRLRDRPDRPALGGARRRAGLLHGAVRRLPRQRVRAQRDRGGTAGRLRGRDADRHEPGSVGRRAAVRAAGPASRSSSCSRGTPARNGSSGSGSGSTAAPSDDPGAPRSDGRVARSARATHHGCRAGG